MGVVWKFFSLVYQFSLLSPSLWETARYRLKYCLKRPLSPKQPTNQCKVDNLGQDHVLITVNRLSFTDQIRKYVISTLDLNVDSFVEPLKGYCTIFPLFPDIFLINRYLLEKQTAENPIKNFNPNCNY